MQPKVFKSGKTGKSVTVSIPPKVSKRHEHITKIDEYLYLGNQFAALDIQILLSHGIQHIVQLIKLDSSPAIDNGIQILKLPLRGGKNTDIRPAISPALSYMHCAISSGQNVLVHCKHGKNRSASIVIAYLMAVKNLNFDEAERFVVAKRPVVELYPQGKNILRSLGTEGIMKIMNPA